MVRASFSTKVEIEFSAAAEAGEVQKSISISPRRHAFCPVVMLEKTLLPESKAKPASISVTLELYVSGGHWQASLARPG